MPRRRRHDGRRSAASTCWSATRASRSCIRSRNSRSPSGSRMLAIHVDGAFLVTKACAAAHVRARQRQPHLHGLGAFEGRFAAEGAVRRGEARAAGSRAQPIAKEGGKRGVRANVICPGFVRTPLVEKQIPEQAEAFGISEQDVIQKIMLKDTVDGEFTSLDDVAEVAAALRRVPLQCAHRPVARREPRLAHGVERPLDPSQQQKARQCRRRPPRRKPESTSGTTPRAAHPVRVPRQHLPLADGRGGVSHARRPRGARAAGRRRRRRAPATGTSACRRTGAPSRTRPSAATTCAPCARARSSARTSSASTGSSRWISGNLRELTRCARRTIAGSSACSSTSRRISACGTCPIRTTAARLHFERVLDLVEQASDALLAHLFERTRRVTARRRRAGEPARSDTLSTASRTPMKKGRRHRPFPDASGCAIASATSSSLRVSTISSGSLATSTRGGRTRRGRGVSLDSALGRRRRMRRFHQHQVGARRQRQRHRRQVELLLRSHRSDCGPLTPAVRATLDGIGA